LALMVRTSCAIKPSCNSDSSINFSTPNHALSSKTDAVYIKHYFQ
jgi:hypothetical protein